MPQARTDRARKRPTAPALDCGTAPAEIYRDGGFGRPVGRVAASLFENPIPERHDQADFLGHGDKLIGGIQTALRMLPAQQCLEFRKLRRG